MKRKAFTRIRMLIGMALIGSFATTSYAQFNLDKLKSLAEQANAYQEKLKQVSPSNVPAQTDPSAQTNSDAVLTSETRGGNITQTGPDILGIRLGMNPTEVQKIIQNFPRLESFSEKATLDHLPASGGWKPIPNSEYVGRLQAHQGKSIRVESLIVAFTPFAQQERAVSIERKQIFPPDQKPTVETLVSALTEKYGPISYKRNNAFGNNYFWRYDANGKPLGANVDTKNITQNNGCDCAPQPYPGLTSSCPTQKAMNRASENIQKYLLETENCGHTQVHVKLALERPDSPLVNFMTVYLGAWGEAVAARRSADKIRENYGKTAREKEIGEAGKRKPEL